MLNNVFLKTMRDQIKPILFWSLGISLFIIALTAFFPSIKESSADLNKYLETLPPALKNVIGETTNYATPEGYFNSEFFSITLPLVFLVFAITFASGALLAEESKGTLNLLLANPISRSRVLIEKFLALLATMTIILLICWEAFALGALLINIQIDLLKVLTALISVGALATFFSSFCLGLSGLVNNRGLVVGLTAFLVAGSFFLNALAPIVEATKPLQKYSPFYLYAHNSPLINGVKIEDLAILLGFSVIFVLIGIVGFSKRDLG